MYKTNKMYTHIQNIEIETMVKSWVQVYEEGIIGKDLQKSTFMLID